MSTPKLITFIDNVGRTLFGEEVFQDTKHLLVKNPALIHVTPTPQGQLNVQTIPLYFREFISEKNRHAGTTWKFNLENITVGVDVDNDERLVDQYNKLFTPIAESAVEEVNDPKVIKLFES